MNIFLEDALAIQKGTGVAQHTLNLFHHLKEIPEINSLYLIEKPFLNKVPSVVLRRFLHIAWLNTRLQLSLRRRKVDIIHFTDHLIPVLKLSDAKYIVTIHDLAAWRFPEVLPIASYFYIKLAISHAVKTADLILTVSNTVKNEIIEFFGVNENRIRVVYNGVSRVFWEFPKKVSGELTAIKDKFGIRKNFLLFVGTIEERKNLITLVRAFEKLKNFRDLQLVLVGWPGYGYSNLCKYLERKNLKCKVILTGYVSEEEKIALYDLATAFIYPSLYEGFGIPLVEAMVRKVPIVASRIPSTEEVAGEVAIYYDDPCDYEALAKRILELLENDNLQQDLVEKGWRRAQEFSWEKISRRYLQACLELLGVNKP